MSQPKGEAVAEETFSEVDVADYLKSHPDFFERHSSVLRRLKVPHQSGAATVSLVERQVSVLRERNDELELKLAELVEVAKANNELVDNIHHLAIRLMRTEGIDARLEALEESLRENFGAERAVLVLFAGDEKPPVSRPGFVKTFERNDAALAPFATFLRSARARSGPLRDRQREILFDREADSITSAAMVPIGEHAGQGFLTIGSKDPNQFHPSQRVDFLGRLGELVATALEGGDARDRES